MYLARIYAAASVPDELLEAGRVDGAGDIRLFFRIGPRLMLPALVTGSLLSVVSLVVAFLLLQRYWRSGLSTGSLKA